MKNILVLYYSQSGQLEEIAKSISASLQNGPGVNVVFHEIDMVTPFPFPWNKESFFEVFPESFLQIPAAVKPMPQEILEIKFDLVLLHYQVWFLSPSIPVNSFLKSSDAQKVLHGVPVVTISGSRNMWAMAQEKVKVLLKQNSALLKGNIALVDRAPHLVSVITIVEWMFSGVKKKHLGVFPLPGVSDKDIKGAQRFGETILTALTSNNFNDLQLKLTAQDAVKISPYLIAVDKKGNYVFGKWSAIIIKKMGVARSRLLQVFVVYLVLAIWVISPIVYILHLLTYPFKTGKIKREIAYYKGV